MIKWEYKTVTGTYDELTELNKLGKRGWEVIAVAETSSSTLKTFYLKRMMVGNNGGDELIEG